MTLDAIALENFGVYAGRQEAVLAPADERHPIVLIGGLNGGGKTTLLDAVQLALFGPKARCSGRGRLRYQDYLREMIHRGADPKGGASIELRFRRTIEGEVRCQGLTRCWWQGSKGVEERVEVTLDGKPDAVLSEHWDEYIEGYIPSGIAHLFFFDAEQIREIAEGEHAAEILGAAVHTLLGLDLVDRLDTDLVALARRKRTLARSAAEVEKSRASEEELERYQNLLDQAKQRQGTLAIELGRIAQELSRWEEKFRQEGGDLYLVRADLEAERSRIEKDLARDKTELSDLAAGPAPFLLIPELLEATEAQAQREQLAHKSSLLSATLQERDLELLAHLREWDLSGPALNLIRRFLEDDRARRCAEAGEGRILGSDVQLPVDLRHLRSVILPDARAQLLKRIANIGTLQERLARVELELSRVPSEDAIAVIQRELACLRERHLRKEAEAAGEEEKIRVLSRQFDDARRKYERELVQEVDVQAGREHDARVIKHAGRVRETLARFRVAVIRKHAGRLENLVLESFNCLLRKRGLIGGLRIDPETFRLELTGGDGEVLGFDRLSAGERQLLATALLWGLAKGSGRLLPMIIDTPLGRLDTSHRRHLVERYFPVASRQVILLSTDEEVDQASLERLKPHIGRSYTLVFDEERRATQIVPGYFWKHEATR